MATPYIRECIENKDKTKYIREQIAMGTSQYGMQTFDQSLYFLYSQNGLITLDEAMKRASNPDEFRLKLEGVQFTGDEAREQMEGMLIGADSFGRFAGGRAHRVTRRFRASVASSAEAYRKALQLLARRPHFETPRFGASSPIAASTTDACDETVDRLNAGVRDRRSGGGHRLRREQTAQTADG